jgi:tRNA (cytidine/uridine-2'-O-)-methyltransferase
MAFHIALLEALLPTTVGALARRCLAKDASLHLVGPLPFTADDEALRAAGPSDWAPLDWWIHPGWRAFRDAMRRDRCLYFSVDGERDPTTAPFKANSVLVIGNEEGTLPEPIRAKYPDRIYKLPMPGRKKTVDIAASAELLLGLAADGVARGAAKRNEAAVEVKPTTLRYGRGRGRT